MEHVKRKNPAGQGTPILQGMQWRGITLGHADAAARLISLISISAKLRREARTFGCFRTKQNSSL